MNATLNAFQNFIQKLFILNFHFKVKFFKKSILPHPYRSSHRRRSIKEDLQNRP